MVQGVVVSVSGRPAAPLEALPLKRPSPRRYRKLRFQNFRPGIQPPQWAGLCRIARSVSGARVTRGPRLLPAAQLRVPAVLPLRLRFPSLLFPALVVGGAMNKKKKPFLGMPAPLGYVPGLGRG